MLRRSLNSAWRVESSAIVMATDAPADTSELPRGPAWVAPVRLRSASRAISSAGERPAHTGEVTGSNPVSPTENTMQVSSNGTGTGPDASRVPPEVRGPVSVPPGYAAETRAPLPGLDRKLQIVLIEDDSGDALMVQDMLDEVEPDMTITWVRSIAEAEPVLGKDTRCVLLDLQLPDATDFVALQKVLAAAPRAAVVVLTGFADSQRGLEAVARGAQDYLNKSQVDPELLARAVRYAIE